MSALIPSQSMIWFFCRWAKFGPGFILGGRFFMQTDTWGEIEAEWSRLKQDRYNCRLAFLVLADKSHQTCLTLWSLPSACVTGISLKYRYQILGVWALLHPTYMHSTHTQPNSGIRLLLGDNVSKAIYSCIQPCDYGSGWLPRTYLSPGTV